MMASLDHILFDHLYASAPQWLAVPITHLCTWGAMWILVSLGLLWFGHGENRRTGAALAAGLATSFVIVDLTLKPLVSRVRPCEVLDVQLFDTLMNPLSSSFPSGHASIAFTGAWIVGVRFRVIRVPALVLAAMIALSRIVVGAHWPSDVAVGSASGLAIGVALARALAIESATFDRLVS